MATKTKKPTPADPQPTPAPPTPEQIEASFRAECDRVAERFRQTREQFAERASSNPTDAIEWMAGVIVEAQAEAAMWAAMAKILDDESISLADRFTKILARVAEEQDRILDLRMWEAGSSSPFANVAKSATVSGRAKALKMIAIHAGVALEKLGAAGRGEGVR